MDTSFFSAFFRLNEQSQTRTSSFAPQSTPSGVSLFQSSSAFSATTSSFTTQQHHHHSGFPDSSRSVFPSLEIDSTPVFRDAAPTIQV
jgi:hypothetical protein